MPLDPEQSGPGGFLFAPMKDAKSCANCKHLSPPAEIRFENGATEERVICMAEQWSGSVKLLTVYKEHRKNYREIAARCEKYQSSQVADNGLVNQ